METNLIDKLVAELVEKTPLAHDVAVEVSVECVSLIVDMLKTKFPEASPQYQREFVSSFLQTKAFREKIANFVASICKSSDIE